MRSAYFIKIGCLVAPMTGAVCLADTVTLKSSLRLNAGATVITLGDIAELEGAEAGAFGTLEIAELAGTDKAMEISVEQVRSKLDAAGAHWGRISLNGRSVAVRPAPNSQAGPPMAMAACSVDSQRNAAVPVPSKVEQNASSLVDSPTVRGTIASLIATNLHVEPANLQLSFDRDDDELLNTATSAHRFEVQPLSSFASDRIQLGIRLWSDGRVQNQQSISVLPKLRIPVAVLKTDIKKDHVITDSDVLESEQWLSPSQAGQIVPRVAAIGRLTTKNLDAGDTLRDKNLRQSTMVKRGDQAIIRCLVGGAIISMQAEAKADGGIGDVVEFRKPGERESFLATITKRGEAVIDLGRKPVADLTH